MFYSAARFGAQLALCAVGLLFVACDSTVDAPEYTFESVRAAYRSSDIQVAAPKSDGTKRYLLEVAFDPDHPDVRLPDYVNVLPRRRGGGTTPIRDDGRMPDRIAGDGLFTGFIPDGCVPESSASKSGEKVDTDRKSKCTFDFVGPGEKCGDYEICPERVHRSFLWGLIEYDTDVAICFCLVECEFEIPLFG